jgi:predicted HicB family RNase H-like nuclease
MSKRPDETKDDSDVTRSIRFPRAIYDRATAGAAADDRTLNSYVIRALREKLDRDDDVKRGRGR